MTHIEPPIGTGDMAPPAPDEADLIRLAEACGVGHWRLDLAANVCHLSPIARELLWPSSLGTSVLPTQWAAILAGALGIALLQERGNLLDRIDSAHWLWRGVVFALLAHTLTCFVATDQHTAFLYFQF